MAVATNVSLEYKNDLEKRTIAGQAQDIWRRQEADIARSEKMYEQRFKASQGGQVVRTSLASGTRRLRKVRDNSNNKIVRSIAGTAAAKLKVSAANTWIGSWAIFWYLTFQLPIAVISAAGIGIAYAVYTSIAALPGGKYALVVVEEVVKLSTSVFSEAVRFFADRLFGLNFDPLAIFIVPFALVFFLGLFQLILTWFIYSLVGVKSLTGQHGGIKGVMFILAGVGYAIPILNLFPLIFLWMAVVWKYPK